MGKEYASGVYALHLSPNYFASTIGWPGLDLLLIKDELERNVGKLNTSLYNSTASSVSGSYGFRRNLIT